MEKMPWRKNGRKAREFLRKYAIDLIELGKSRNAIAKVFGCHHSAVYQWWERYKEEGMSGIKNHKQGAPTKLSESQQKMVFEALTTKRPESFNLSFGLWSISTVRKYIKEAFGIELSEVSTGRLLKKFGLIMHKKLLSSVYGEQVSVDQWIAAEYDAIRKRARKADATIYFLNTSSIKSHYRLKMISAVSAQGKMRFLVINGEVTSKKIIDFLERLIANEAKQVYLMVECFPVSADRKIHAFVASSHRTLEVIEVPRSIYQDALR